MNDDELIDQTLAGDTTAFGELVRKYQDRIFHSVSHVLASPDDAEDVAQEAFVQAFLKLEGFQRTASFYTWVYRIAINGALSLRRKRRPRVSLDKMQDDDGQTPADPGPRPDGRLHQQERAEQVHAALAALADDYRTVLVLREIDGFDYETIADILDLPVGTVRSRLHRARLQFKQQVQQILKEDVPSS